MSVVEEVETPLAIFDEGGAFSPRRAFGVEIDLGGRPAFDGGPVETPEAEDLCAGDVAAVVSVDQPDVRGAIVGFDEGGKFGKIGALSDGSKGCFLDGEDIPVEREVPGGEGFGGFEETTDAGRKVGRAAKGFGAGGELFVRSGFGVDPVGVDGMIVVVEEALGREEAEAVSA